MELHIYNTSAYLSITHFSEIFKKNYELAPKAIRESFGSSTYAHKSIVSSNPEFSREFAEQVLSERCTAIRTKPEGSRNQSPIRHATDIGKIIRMGSPGAKVAADSLLEAAISSGLTHFESVSAIKAGIKYGKTLVH